MEKMVELTGSLKGFEMLEVLKKIGQAAIEFCNQLFGISEQLIYNFQS